MVFLSEELLSKLKDSDLLQSAGFINSQWEYGQLEDVFEVDSNVRPSTFLAHFNIF
jgi:hypothetical protein